MKDIPCTDCGVRYHSCVMDFDHRPGTKKRWAVSHGVNRYASLQSILAEIAKCDVVCANCHRMRTYKRGR